jgi:hypothetical protein
LVETLQDKRIKKDVPVGSAISNQRSSLIGKNVGTR